MENSVKLRIVFMGTSSFAATILEALVKNKYNIISVYTRPDKKNGRNRELQKSAVKEVAEKNNLLFFQPEKFNDEAIEKLKMQKPDMFIVAAYGKILSEEVLAIPGFGAINIHPSLLPRFRGPSPLQNVILEGEKETGTTIMLMNEGIDTGDILSQEKISIASDECYSQLLEKVAKLSVELLLKTLPLWAKRKIIPQKQNEMLATYCQIIQRQDGKIIWSDDALDIYNRFRAFYPWPGIFTYWEVDGYNSRLKIQKMDLFSDNEDFPFHAGEVFEKDDKILVQTGKGVLILKEIQLEGKGITTTQAFKHGHANFIGSILK